MGIVGGLCLVYLIPLVTSIFMRKPLPVQLEPFSIFLSLVVAVFTGVLAGWYPAWRASHLDPIEALRHT